MDYKNFFKIVSLTVLYFCIISGVIVGGVLLLKPDLFNNSFYLGDIFNDRPTNVLLLGRDKVSNNTDVVVLVNFNPRTNRINVLSIPRDTRVYSKGRYHKINAIHAIGKNDLAKEVVGEIVGQKIDYVVLADPKGFRNIIDILDGVEVNVPMDMKYDDNEQDLHINLKKGTQVLYGEKAEEFVRYRHGYKDGDLGRIDAQQIFFKAFIEQKMSPKYILRADKILSEVFKHVETDMSFTQALGFTKYARNLKMENINFLKLPGEDRKTSSAWYYIYDPKKTKELIDEYFNGITPQTADKP